MHARGRRRRILVLTLAVMVSLAASALWAERNLTRVVLSLAQARARSMAVQALHESASELLSSGQVTYDSLISVSTDAAGQVRLIQANTPEMNRLAATVSLAAQQKLQRQEQTVSVPLGSVTGLTLLSGHGPRIPVRILPLGSVNASFHTDFQTAGINQTRHRISLTLTAAMQLVIPTGAQKMEVTTQVAMAESIIVGEVPDTFTDVGHDMDMLDLVP